MMKFTIKEWAELISGPISMKEQDQRIFKHADLPTVKDKLSITLLLKIHKHFSDWSTVFRNWDSNAGIWELDDGLALNKWYHIAYTLSDP
ncbi:16087_t:CDS:2 [Rhizophagus irregularis]|nr:16087_t:CDS:2 [Rhizophagus irregularis]